MAPHAVFASTQGSATNAAATWGEPALAHPGAKHAGALQGGARQLTPKQWSALLTAWDRAARQHEAQRIATQRELLQLLDAQPETAVRTLESQPTFAAVPTPDGWLIVQL